MPERIKLTSIPENGGTQGAERVSLQSMEWTPGEDWEHPIDVQHPDLGNVDRAMLKTWADAGPETMRRNLEKRGFEARNIEGMDFALRKPGEKTWHVMDQSRIFGGVLGVGEPLQDVAEVLPSYAMHFLTAMGLSKIPGLSKLPMLGRGAAYGTGSLGVEALKQSLAPKLGFDVVPEEAAGKVGMEALFTGVAEPAGELLMRAARSPLGQKVIGAGKKGLSAGARGVQRVFGKGMPPEGDLPPETVEALQRLTGREAPPPTPPPDQPGKFEAGKRFAPNMRDVFNDRRIDYDARKFLSTIVRGSPEHFESRLEQLYQMIRETHPPGSRVPAEDVIARVEGLADEWLQKVRSGEYPNPQAETDIAVEAARRKVTPPDATPDVASAPPAGETPLVLPGDVAESSGRDEALWAWARENAEAVGSEGWKTGETVDDLAERFYRGIRSDPAAYREFTEGDAFRGIEGVPPVEDLPDVGWGMPKEFPESFEPDVKLKGDVTSPGDLAARAAERATWRRRDLGVPGKERAALERELRERLANPDPREVEQLRAAIEKGLYEPAPEAAMDTYAALIRAGVEPGEARRMAMEGPGRGLGGPETPPPGAPPSGPPGPPGAPPGGSGAPGTPPEPEMTPGYHWSRWMDRPPRKPRTPGRPPEGPPPAPEPPVDLPPAPPMEYTGFDEFLGGAGKPDLPITGLDEYGRSVRSDPRKWVEYWRAELPRRESREAMAKRRLAEYKPYDGPFDELRREDAQYRARLEQTAKEYAADADQARRELTRWEGLRPPEPPPPPSGPGPRRDPGGRQSGHALIPGGGQKLPPGGQTGRPGEVPADPQSRLKIAARLAQELTGGAFRGAGGLLELPSRMVKRGIEKAGESIPRGTGSRSRLANQRRSGAVYLDEVARQARIQYADDPLVSGAAGEAIDMLRRPGLRTTEIQKVGQSMKDAFRGHPDLMEAMDLDISARLPTTSPAGILGIPFTAGPEIELGRQVSGLFGGPVGPMIPGVSAGMAGIGFAGVLGKGVRKIGLAIMRDKSGDTLRQIMQSAPPAVQQKLGPLLRKVGGSPNSWKAATWVALHDPAVREYLESMGGAEE